MYGPPMTDNGIYNRIVARTREGLGHPINPHLFRDCAATSIAIEDPAHIGIASRLLGHRTRSTTERYYNQARGVEASHKALRNDLIRDIRTMRVRIGKPADGILISSDIASAGKSAGYDFAYDWFENELCPAAGCDVEDMFVVPGNHDVDWTAEPGPAQNHARDSLRAVEEHRIDDELRKWLG
jgi:3',5'-cyclic AMP phosphodiesterase CpdA